MRSRREVVQHAAAFQHIVNAYVKERKPMSEDLIRQTHERLMQGISGEDAGVLNSKYFAGTYRDGEQRAFAGAVEFTRPADAPKAMKGMCDNLQKDLAEAERTGYLDSFMLASEYCDRMVNIHPFRDGHGRMCRLILNAILVKYAGIVVSLGEKGQDRDEYLEIAKESTRVGGHPAQVGKLVLESAGGALRKLKGTLKGKKKSGAKWLVELDRRSFFFQWYIGEHRFVHRPVFCGHDCGVDD